MGELAARHRGFTQETWTTRIWWQEPRCIFLFTPPVPFSRSAMVMPDKATAKWTSLRLRPHSPGLFNSLCAKTCECVGRGPKHRPISLRWVFMKISLKPRKWQYAKTIDFLVSEKRLSRDDAYMLASIAVDFH